ncbi:hypothetical protein QWJ34_08540 [Saccharibacillus sp. CPCC 101409]|uniref:hypothetical protein n=1 Tax=Saccharibacillus sp. CPCC 101409 TaxID=3058041 RepID=UPI002672E988|nr:hypothetical protein [Saccharibacillus sp. CPCC 101409]MDO3409809.1 hypothetical protein [Saccharibacillus sp. CPCC 101409]
MKTKLPIALAALLAVLVVCGLGAGAVHFFRPQAVQTFELQVGQTRRDDLPGVLDGGRASYRKNKRLFAVVVYPDPDQVELNRKARVYVTEDSSGKVVQEHPIAEHGDLAAEEIPLNNSDWEPGRYTVSFERGGQLIAQKKIVLAE